MSERLIICLRGVTAVAASVVLSSCTGSTTKPTAPPTDAPTISCPASISAQSTDGNPVAVSFANPTTTGGQAPLTVACTPASGSTFPVGTNSVSCTVTDAVKRTAPCSFNVTVSPVPKLSVTNFVAFGDSITFGEDGQNFSMQSRSRLRPAVQLPLPQTYPGALQQMLLGRYTMQPTIRVDNAGQRGESVTGDGPEPSEPAPSRFSRTIAGGQYQVALIMEGANDLHSRDSKVYPAVIAGLRQMILDAKSRNMQAFLATIPPENAAAPGERGLAADQVAPFNDQVRGLAFEQAVPLVDVFAALNADINTYIGPDGLHPTAAGYLKIAEQFFAAIEATLETKQSDTSIRFGASRGRPGTGITTPTTVVRPSQTPSRKPR